MIRFTLQDPERTRALRRDFDHRDLNHKFVKWLYRKGHLEKYKDVISSERARRGRIPRGFDVHHIIPLSGGGTNHVSNLCLMEQSLHKFINKKCFDPVLRHVRIGESVDIDVPDFGSIALRREYAPWVDRKIAHARQSDSK